MVSAAPTGTLAVLPSKSSSSPSCPSCSRPEPQELRPSFRWASCHPSLYWILYNINNRLLPATSVAILVSDWLMRWTLIDQLGHHLHLTCIVQRRLKSHQFYQLLTVFPIDVLLSSFQYKKSHVKCKNKIHKNIPHFLTSNRGK